ncbi:MAG: hypothetical protein KJT03_20110 [Verrucomicrobiae bacterium]|nr:hypothetical protein [Verrucomicrobiae bacterium]
MQLTTHNWLTRLLNHFKAHPWLTGIFVACVILWTGIAMVYFQEWSLLRKIAAGICWGTFCAIIVTATRTVNAGES